VFDSYPEPHIPHLGVEKGGVVQDFRKLDVWTKAHHLVLAIYQATKLMPKK
jgi:hypothetical protein